MPHLDMEEALDKAFAEGFVLHSLLENEVVADGELFPRFDFVRGVHRFISFRVRDVF